jgi:hypothetical protein
MTPDIMNIRGRLFHCRVDLEFRGSLLACLSAWYLFTTHEPFGWFLELDRPLAGKRLLDERDMLLLMSSEPEPPLASAA